MLSDGIQECVDRVGDLVRRLKTQDIDNRETLNADIQMATAEALRVCAALTTITELLRRD